MKVIDLLNLVYENKAPKKIKYGGMIYIYSDFRYKTEDGYSSLENFNLFHPGFINDEVEIIEEIEKSKKIEKIKMNGNEFYSEYIEGWIKKSESDAYGEYLSNKLNEVIDKLNYISEKSKDDEI